MTTANDELLQRTAAARGDAPAEPDATTDHDIVPLQAQPMEPTPLA